MRLMMRKLGESEYLAGAEAGRMLLARLITEIGSPSEPEPAFLDFSGVAVATASFIRGAVLGFRDYVRSSKPSIYPVIANANQAIIEELEFYLTAQRDAIWCCEIDANGTPSQPRLIGVLDAAVRRAFDAVLNLRRATVAEVAGKFPDAGLKGTTAWNNRLATLVKQGLLIEWHNGSAKEFAPVIGGH